MENRSYGDVVEAPYVKTLARQGALFTQSYGNYHPSQPNYLILFSGSNQGVRGNSCPHTFTTANLGRALLDAGLSFVGYSDGLPRAGYTGCRHGDYARKHNPWSNFANVPAALSLPFSAFPSDFARLPTVSFVVPNLAHDMHDGSVAAGDRWLEHNLGGYVAWARTHRSLLVLTWDEDDGSKHNHIATIIVGAGVTPGSYAERIDHYRVLRTIEDAYGLAPAGATARAAPITSIWTRG